MILITLLFYINVNLLYSVTHYTYFCFLEYCCSNFTDLKFIICVAVVANSSSEYILYQITCFLLAVIFFSFKLNMIIGSSIIYIYIYIYIYICTFICIYICIYIQREREKERDVYIIYRYFDFLVFSPQNICKTLKYSETGA